VHRFWRHPLAAPVGSRASRRDGIGPGSLFPGRQSNQFHRIDLDPLPGASDQRQVTELGRYKEPLLKGGIDARGASLGGVSPSVDPFQLACSGLVRARGMEMFRCVPPELAESELSVVAC